MIRTTFVAAVEQLVDEPDRAIEMGQRGRRWVETAASPAAVAEAYERLVWWSLMRRRRRWRSVDRVVERWSARFGTAGAPAPSPATLRTE